MILSYYTLLAMVILGLVFSFIIWKLECRIEALEDTQKKRKSHVLESVATFAAIGLGSLLINKVRKFTKNREKNPKKRLYRPLDQLVNYDINNPLVHSPEKPFLLLSINEHPFWVNAKQRIPFCEAEVVDVLNGEHRLQKGDIISYKKNNIIQALTPEEFAQREIPKEELQKMKDWFPKDNKPSDL